MKFNKRLKAERKKKLVFFLFQFSRNPQKTVNNVIMALIGRKSGQNLIEQGTFVWTLEEGGRGLRSMSLLQLLDYMI